MKNHFTYFTLCSYYIREQKNYLEKVRQLIIEVMKAFGFVDLEVEELGEVKLLKIGRYGLLFNQDTGENTA